jgi:transposase
MHSALLASATLRIPKKGKTTLTAKRPIPIGHQRIAWLMLKAQLGRNRYLKALYEASPTIAQIAYTARELFEFIRRRDAAAWPGWLEAAANSPYARFARRLQRDKHAVAAALQLPWSNGMVEG